VESVALDGEVVWLSPNGVSDFDALHGRMHDAWAIMLAFDLLEVDGEDLRDRPLVERKLRLRKLLARGGGGLQFVEHLEGDGAAIFAEVCRMGLEGIVSKRADSLYRAGPSKVWRKVKNANHPSIARIKDAIESGNFRRR
jgi:ATP-dependent DNA ligase